MSPSFSSLHLLKSILRINQEEIDLYEKENCIHYFRRRQYETKNIYNRAVCCTGLDRQIDMHRAIRSWGNRHMGLDGYRARQRWVQCANSYVHPALIIFLLRDLGICTLYPVQPTCMCLALCLYSPMYMPSPIPVYRPMYWWGIE